MRNQLFKTVLAFLEENIKYFGVNFKNQMDKRDLIVNLIVQSSQPLKSLTGTISYYCTHIIEPIQRYSASVKG